MARSLACVALASATFTVAVLPPARAQGPYAPTPEAAAALATHRSPHAVAYGAAARVRWVSVPRWFLGAFLKESVPLSSYGVGAEFFRRKRDKDDENAYFDMSIGFAYQKMGPPDGNWLGKGKSASLDTDLVQFRNFGFIGIDAAFMWRQYLTQYFGLHYGAGFGLAVVTGQMLRTSAWGCTEDNASDPRQCKPMVCRGPTCTETELKATEGPKDHGPPDPHRFADQNVPGAIPILNMMVGLNFRIPDVPRLDIRLDAGFYNAFFVGTGIGYLF